MHMADALVSPAVSGVMFAASTAAMVYSVRQTKNHMDEKKVPLMGVMGAFVFAAQMINFTIPATGSSGHIGGGLLLAALLGPGPAFIALAAVLLIQCLFFADGGLLALGCNIFNMGFFPCFVAYPLIFKPFIKKGLNAKNITLGAVLACTVGLQLGAFSVVLETLASRITQLPFGAFVALMQPIHLAIGVAEGFITAAVLVYVYHARPELLDAAEKNQVQAKRPQSAKKVLIILGVIAVVTASGLSLFASAYPDGLEWSMEKVAGTAELESDTVLHENAAALQETTAFMPDYAFADEELQEAAAGTSVAGLAGGAIVLAVAGGIGLLIKLGKNRTKAEG
ncbi:MAG: energy-coupling factor ABC transporter permease [Oscillospiraceae bacterium]|nr:energy-coupling factor ABC transporter permease [Oscillospiraceae bacterium]